MQSKRLMILRRQCSRVAIAQLFKDLSSADVSETRSSLRPIHVCIFEVNENRNAQKLDHSIGLAELFLNIIFSIDDIFLWKGVALSVEPSFQLVRVTAALSRPWQSQWTCCRAMILEKWSSYAIQSLSQDTHRCTATRKSSDWIKIWASAQKVVAAGCLHRIPRSPKEIQTQITKYPAHLLDIHEHCPFSFFRVLFISLRRRLRVKLVVNCRQVPEIRPKIICSKQNTSHAAPTP